MPKMVYFTPTEVASHNRADDLWVSFFEKVCDLTEISLSHIGDPLMKPILDAAGQDISHWFDPKTEDIRTYVDPDSGGLRPYTPHGRFLHVPPSYPDTFWAYETRTPWWQNSKLIKGFVTMKTRFINVVNTLTKQKHVVEVCCEETLKDILRRYLFYNAHAGSYTWKYDRVPLDMSKTLEENGIKDEDDDFYDFRIDDSVYRQTIHLYFNDDLTEA